MVDGGAVVLLDPMPVDGPVVRDGVVEPGAVSVDAVEPVSGVVAVVVVVVSTTVLVEVPVVGAIDEPLPEVDEPGAVVDAGAGGPVPDEELTEPVPVADGDVVIDENRRVPPAALLGPADVPTAESTGPWDPPAPVEDPVAEAVEDPAGNATGAPPACNAPLPWSLPPLSGRALSRPELPSGWTEPEASWDNSPFRSSAMAACSTRSLTRCSPAEASARAAAASWVWPARSAFLAALSAPRTSCTATAEPAWSAQTTSVTGHSASPGRALRAPTTAEPISRAQMAAATAATGRAERGRRGAARTARLASSTDGDSGNRRAPR